MTSQTRPQLRGEVCLTLSHKSHDPNGVQIVHRAGSFSYVRLFMRGTVLVLNRPQTRHLLTQWRRLTLLSGWGYGWKVTRSYVGDDEEY